MPVIQIQRRFMTLGKFRLGERGPKGEPRKRETWRVTSASQRLLEAVAEKYGGTVRPWEGAPEEGFFEVSTDAREIDIVLPPVFSSIDGSPTTAYSQWFETWSAGGCQRRCDGATEMLSGKPCLCAAAVEEDGEDVRMCKITTRLSFMLPDIPGLGVWTCESHGWNAAVELPGTLDVLMMAAAEHKFVPAVLRADPRTKKEGGKTHRFVVPVIDLPGVTVEQLASGDVPSVLNPPTIASKERPGLPAAPDPPTDPLAAGEEPVGGTPPPLPGEEDQWASEADVTEVLEIAARIDDETHDKAVKGIAKHRESHDGRVDAKWLSKQSDALLKKAAAVPV